MRLRERKCVCVFMCVESCRAGTASVCHTQQQCVCVPGQCTAGPPATKAGFILTSVRRWSRSYMHPPSGQDHFILSLCTVFLLPPAPALSVCLSDWLIYMFISHFHTVSLPLALHLLYILDCHSLLFLLLHLVYDVHLHQ